MTSELTSLGRPDRPLAARAKADHEVSHRSVGPGGRPARSGDRTGRGPPALARPFSAGRLHSPRGGHHHDHSATL